MLGRNGYLNPFDSYINNILLHIDGSLEEKEEMREEIEIHLELTKQSYIEQGYTEKKSVILTMQDFGAESVIGKQLQHSRYPYHLTLLFYIGIGFVFYLFLYLSLYTKYGFVGFEYCPEYIGITIGILLGAILVFFGLNPSLMFGKKLLINTILFCIISISFISFLIITTQQRILEIPHDLYSETFKMLGVSLVLLSSLLIIMTIWKKETDITSLKHFQRKNFMHCWNFFLVLLLSYIMCDYLLFIFSLQLSIMGVLISVLAPIGIYLLWAISYWIQYICMDHKPIIAYGIMLLSGILIPVYILTIFK